MIIELLTGIAIGTPIVVGGLYKISGIATKVAVLELADADAKELVLSKLDAIAEKIDLRCDSLDHRVQRIERKVLNGEYKDPHR